MKSSYGDYNKHDADVERSPTSSSDACTFDGVTHDTRTNHMNGTAVSVEAEGLRVYRSKCHVHDIPEIARGMTWNDPFYDAYHHHNCTSSTNVADIIVAFDLDRTLYDRTTYELLKWFILTPVVCLVLTTLLIYFIWGMFNALCSFMIYGAYYFFLSMFYVGMECTRREKKARLERAHIAISTRGIYIDEVDAPGSFNLMSRTRITYDEITTCRVMSEYNQFYRTMSYKIAMNTKYDVGGFPRYIIEVIPNQQEFVNIVDAMMERHTSRVVNASTTVKESRNVSNGVV